MNEEAQTVRDALAKAARRLGQVNERDDAVAVIDEGGLPLTSILRRWQGQAGNVLTEADAAAHGRVALELLEQYEALLAQAEAHHGPIRDAVADEVLASRPFWERLTAGA